MWCTGKTEPLPGKPSFGATVFLLEFFSRFLGCDDEGEKAGFIGKFVGLESSPGDSVGDLEEEFVWEVRMREIRGVLQFGIGEVGGGG